jgi:beta-ureidopropionase
VGAGDGGKIPPKFQEEHKVTGGLIMRLLTFSRMGLLWGCALALTAAYRGNALGASPSGGDRIVRVVTVSQDGLEFGTHDLLEPTMERLNRAASFHPDIACLPEVFSNRAPEQVPGVVTERLAAWAREHSSYVIFGLKTKQGDSVFNSAILLDRKGQVIGKYNKVHPTEGEMRERITPGEDAGPPVFTTDFGVIGIQICFDVNWRDGWHRLKEQGAKIVFWPSAYPAGRQLSALSLTNQFYVVSAVEGGAAHIYDITGEPLATTGKYQEWAGAALPLGKRLFEVDYNAPKAQEIQKKYGPRVEVTWYHDCDWVAVASLDPNLSTEDLIKEYGLTPLDDYIARSTKEQDQARAEAESKVQAAK